MSNDRYRIEIIKTIYLIQTQLEKSDQMDWDTVHERLSQTAIKEAMWQRTEGGKGLRNNELIVHTFKQLEEEALITVKESKQKTKLYFITDHGRKWGIENLEQDETPLHRPWGILRGFDMTKLTKTYAFVGFVCFALATFGGWLSTCGWLGRWTFSLIPWPGPWGQRHSAYPNVALVEILILILYLVTSIILAGSAYRTYLKIEQGSYVAGKRDTLYLGIVGLFPGFGWILGGICFLLAYYNLGVLLKTDHTPLPPPKKPLLTLKMKKSRIYGLIGLLCFVFGTFSMWVSLWGRLERARFVISPWPGPWGSAPEYYPGHPYLTLEELLPPYGPSTGRFLVLEFYLIGSIFLSILAYRTYLKIEQGYSVDVRISSLFLGLVGLFPGFGWTLGGVFFMLAYRNLGAIKKPDHSPTSTSRALGFIVAIFVFNVGLTITLIGELLNGRVRVAYLSSLGVSFFYIMLTSIRWKKLSKKSINKSIWSAGGIGVGILIITTLFFDHWAFEIPDSWEWYFLTVVCNSLIWILLRNEMLNDHFGDIVT